MSMTKKIEGTTEAWESRELGADEEFVASVDHDDSLIEEAVGLQMISIRLQKSLLEELKMIANINGLGYQPLIKQALKRFVEGEKKMILKQLSSQQQAEAKAEAEAEAQAQAQAQEANVA